jgi:hypothetical protein
MSKHRYAVFFNPNNKGGCWVAVCQMRFFFIWTTYHRSRSDKEGEALVLWRRWVAEEEDKRQRDDGERRTDWKP